MSRTLATLVGAGILVIVLMLTSTLMDKKPDPCGDAEDMQLQVVEIDNYHESGRTRITVVFDVDEKVVASIAANTSITVVMSDLSDTRAWTDKVRLWQYDEDYLNSMY